MRTVLLLFLFTSFVAQAQSTNTDLPVIPQPTFRDDLYQVREGIEGGSLNVRQGGKVVFEIPEGSFFVARRQPDSHWAEIIVYDAEGGEKDVARISVLEKFVERVSTAYLKVRSGQQVSLHDVKLERLQGEFNISYVIKYNDPINGNPSTMRMDDSNLSLVRTALRNPERLNNLTPTDGVPEWERYRAPTIAAAKKSTIRKDNAPSRLELVKLKGKKKITIYNEKGEPSGYPTENERLFKLGQEMIGGKKFYLVGYDGPFGYNVGFIDAAFIESTGEFVDTTKKEAPLPSDAEQPITFPPAQSNWFTLIQDRLDQVDKGECDHEKSILSTGNLEELISDLIEIKEHSPNYDLNRTFNRLKGNMGDCLSVPGERGPTGSSPVFNKTLLPHWAKKEKVVKGYSGSTELGPYTKVWSDEDNYSYYPGIRNSNNEAVDKGELLAIDTLARTCYGEMASVASRPQDRPAQDYFDAVVRVVVNRAEFTEHSALFGRGYNTKFDNLWENYPHIMTPETAAAVQPYQFSAWNNNSVPNLRQMLCPCRIRGQPCHNDGSHAPQTSVNAWDGCLKSAISAVLDRERFKQNSAELSSVFFYTSNLGEEDLPDWAKESERVLMDEYNGRYLQVWDYAPPRVESALRDM
jgi:hypothetical protein